MPGYADAAGHDLTAEGAGRLKVPQAFAKQVYPLFVPGTTLLITDAPVLEENTGKQMSVMGEGNPNAT